MIPIKAALPTILLLFTGVFLSCNTLKKSESVRLKKLTNEAIFQLLGRKEEQSRFWTERRGKIKIDPDLSVRDTFNQKDTVYFSHKMESDELLYPLPKASFHLTIPDTLKSRYELVENGLNYGLNFSVIYQFSPLLPTRQKDIYLLQVYRWYNQCNDRPFQGLSDTSCMRFSERHYARFKVEGDRAIYMDSASSRHPDNNLIWLRTYLKPSYIDARHMYLLKNKQ